MNDQLAQCLHCQRNSDEIPLLQIQFNGSTLWICPQHLPILIHKPAQLAGKLPGAKFVDEPAEHHH
ncbi:MAG TPA: hypothetical protein VLM80_07575 [Anaerolineales bacterium]|nr:hypothetical protein [Anaerolineales bacterium]